MLRGARSLSIYGDSGSRPVPAWFSMRPTGGRVGRCCGCGPLVGASRRVGRAPVRGRDDIGAGACIGCAARVPRELYTDFSVVVPRPVIAACVRDTLGELHASISSAALPELAAALVTARLTGITDTRSHTRYGDRRHALRAVSAEVTARPAGRTAHRRTTMNMDVTTRPGVQSPTSPLRPRHRHDRLEVHNIEGDEPLAGQYLCGNPHLPSGRVCLLPDRHRGGCQFTARPAR
jgi:hypothetical protein